MNWKKLLLQACIITTLLFTSSALSSESRVNVSMMIDCDLYPYANWPDILVHFNATADINATNPDDLTQKEIEVESLSRDILNEVDPKDLNITIFVAGDFISKKAGDYPYNLLISRVSNRLNHEMALHGTKKNETLANMTSSKTMVEEAHICKVQAENNYSGKAVNIKGFMPQNLSQNNDTYNILDELNFTYDVVYQSSNNIRPHPVEKHNIYAVPVSTHNVSTHNYSNNSFPMWDRFAFDHHLNKTQWSQLLKDEYQECKKNNVPMVVIFTNFIIGSNKDYLEAYKEFVDYCVSDKAKFMTTQELVNLYKFAPAAAPKKNQ